MSVGWVAGSVRARAMANRRLGRDAALQLAASPSTAAAVRLLAGTTYGRHVHQGQTAAQAERGVLQALVWNARVLAGWTTRDGVAALRALLAPLEVRNIEDHLLRIAGTEMEAGTRTEAGNQVETDTQTETGSVLGAGPGLTPNTLDLGGLATAWLRVRETSTASGVRAALSTSTWGDPGGDSPREVLLWLRCTAADRVALAAPAAAQWAATSTALLLARELLTGAGPLPSPAAQAAAHVVGRSAAHARDFDDLRVALPRSAGAVLAGVDGAADLWRAEARWWLTVERDSEELVRAPRPGPGVLVGAIGLLAADAWRVRAALTSAAHGGEGLEVFRAAA